MPTNLGRILIAWLFPFPTVTGAQEMHAAPFGLKARYDFDWNKIPLGALAIEGHETDTAYTLRTVIKSKGLVSLFAQHTSDTSVQGHKSAGRYLPTVYETNYQTRNKPKHIKIVSDGAGHIMQETIDPPDAGRPQASAGEKNAASDLLTTVFLIRARLGAALSGTNKRYDMDMYDGRRITHLHFEVIGKGTHAVHGKKRSTIHVLASRAPGSGYTAKELGRMKSEPSMQIYFSDDAALIPLAMEIDYLGTIRGELVTPCAATLEACL